jgi:hypothetical protein
MMPTITSDKALEQLAIASQQIRKAAEAINRYVASEDYRNGVKSAVSAINSFSQQLNQWVAERAKND